MSINAINWNYGENFVDQLNGKVRCLTCQSEFGRCAIEKHRTSRRHMQAKAARHDVQAQTPIQNPLRPTEPAPPPQRQVKGLPLPSRHPPPPPPLQRRQAAQQRHQLEADNEDDPPPRPPREEGEGFEMNAKQAISHFLRCSPLFQSANVEPVTVELEEAIAKRFNKEFRGLEIRDCAVCGIQSPKSHEFETMNVTAVVPLLVCPPRSSKHTHREAFRLYKFRDEFVHLDPSLCDEGGNFTICQECKAAVNNGKVPPLSFAKGFDFGIPKNVPHTLPVLTCVEKTVIQRIQHYRTVMKLQHEVSVSGFFKGHAISFPHDAPQVVSRLPRLNPEDNFVLVLGGAPRQVNRLREAARGLCEVKSGRVLLWLRFLKIHNRFYHEIEIAEDADNLRTLDNAADRIIENAHILGEEARIVEALVGRENYVPSDATEDPRVHGGTVDEILLHEPQNTPAMAALMNATRAFTPRNVATVTRQTVPVNEYDEPDLLLAGGFPYLFPSFSEDLRLGVLKQKTVRHLLLQRSSEFARSGSFVFMQWNQLQRHALTNTIASGVRFGKSGFEEAMNLVNDPELALQLDRAITNPNTEEAKRLEKKLCKTLVTTTSKVPFSPARRRACISKIYALHVYGGIPSVYYTISPADMDMILTLKFSTGQRERNFTLPNIKERMEITSSNPAFAAEVFHILVTQVLHCVLVIDPCHTMFRKTTENNDLGIFGNTKLNFAVVESQGRGSLHLHGVCWGSLRPDVLSDAAGTETEEHIRRVIDSMFSTQLPQELQARTTTQHDVETVPIQMGVVDVLRDPVTNSAETDFPPAREQPRENTVTVTVANRPTLSSSPLPHSQPVAYRKRVADVVDFVQLHKKCTKTCFKNGLNCRFAILAPPVPETGAYKLIRLREGAAIERGVLPQEKELICDMYEAVDKRPMLYATKRQYGVDQTVVGFNPLLSALLGCNTAVFLLGSTAQAIAVLLYLIKYLTKDSQPLEHTLVCFREAKMLAQKFPSRQVGETEEERSKIATKLVLNRFSQRHIGQTEVSSQMACAAILNNPSEYHCHHFSFCFVWQAVKYLKSIPAIDEDEEAEVETGQDQDDLLHLMPGDGAALANQAASYAFRGAGLSEMSFYLWCATVEVVEIARAATGSRGPGREPNMTYHFEPQYELSTSHVQKLRSKHLLPILCGKPPPRLLANDVNRSHLNKHKEYMVAAFLPWKNGANLTELTALYPHYVRILKDSQSMEERVYYSILRNVANGLSTDTETKALINSWRYSWANEKEKENVREIAVDQEVTEEQVQREMRLLEQVQAGAAADLDKHERMLEFIMLLETEMNQANENAQISPPQLAAYVTGLLPNLEPHAVPNHQQRDSEAEDGHEANLDQPNPFQDGEEIIIDSLTGEIVCPDNQLDQQQKAAFTKVLKSAFFLGVEQKLFLLHGGPGCGKSRTVRAILNAISKKSAMCLGTTGIAALNVQGSTIHSALFISVDDKINTLSLTSAVELQRTMKEVKLLVIDEASMLSPSLLARIEGRCREGKSNSLTFGGLTILLVGDFFQLPPVRASSLYSGTFKPCQARFSIDKFEVLPLTSQHRIQNLSEREATHIQLINDMRDENKCKDAMKKMIAASRKLQAEEWIRMTIDEGVPLVVVSNAERAVLNRNMAILWAKRYGFQVIRFHIAKDNVPDQFLEHPEINFYFVPNAPCLITENISLDLGLVNGTQGKLTSLYYTSKKTETDVNNLLRDKAPGSVSWVPIPTAVIVTVEREVRGIKVPTLIAVPVSEMKGKELKLSSNEGVLKVKTKPFKVEVAFAYTFHKIQGVTVSRIILDLSARPPGLGALQFSSVYVALTRVTSPEGILLTALRRQNFSHLEKLKPPSALLNWCKKNKVQ